MTRSNPVARAVRRLRPQAVPDKRRRLKEQAERTEVDRSLSKVEPAREQEAESPTRRGSMAGG
jgi:hypothetical protein